MKRKELNLKNNKSSKKIKSTCDIDAPISEVRAFLENCVSIEDGGARAKVQLGRRKIEDVWVSFEMTIKPKHSGWMAKIRLPSNYPETAFRKYSKEERNGEIAEIYASVFETKNAEKSDWGKFYLKANNIANASGSKYLVLHAFYIYPRLRKVIESLTESESKVFRGLGKKLFCMYLRVLRSHFGQKWKESETLILLEASGGTVGTKEDKIKVQQLVEQGMTLEDAEEKVSLDNNDELVKYYKRTFGFERVDDIRKNGDVMFTRLSDVLERCDKG